MLQFYDKNLSVSVLALAALTLPICASATTQAAPGKCDLSDGYGVSLTERVTEMEACLERAEPGSTDVSERISALSARHRDKAAMDPLARHDSLDKAARAHALDMAARDYVAHTDPEGRSHLDRVRVLDRKLILGASGANMAVVESRADPIDAFNALISDPVNRENLERARFTHMGVGMAEADGRLYLVQVFAQVVGQLDRPLPTKVSDRTGISAQFDDPEFEQVGWRLTTAHGDSVARGLGKVVSTRGLTDQTAYLEVEAMRGEALHGEATYRLRGPALIAE